MAKEADAHSAEDKAQREAIESKNQLDSMVYGMEKMLKEQGDKISGFGAGRCRERDCRRQEGAGVERQSAMDKARETLTQASHKLAEQMYKSAQATPSRALPDAGRAGGMATASGPKKDEGVIDAEYVDVEEKK